AEGAALSASTFGEGKAGNVTVTAKDTVSLTDARIFNRVEAGGVGNGGNITVNAGSLNLTEGARLSAATFGKGNAGNVTLTANDTVSLTDANIFSTVQAGGVGDGGNITVNAGSFNLAEGAALSASTFGEGKAGSVTVTAKDTVSLTDANIFNRVQAGGVGNGGNITVDAGSFNLTEGARLSAATFGKGNAGNVTLTANDTVSLTGSAFIFSTVEAGAVGKGGDININTANLTLQDAGVILTLTREESNNQPGGRGNAGNVNVNVSGVVDIAGTEDGFSSGIRSGVLQGTEGKGGDITINADSLKLRDGAILNAPTENNQKGGDITVNVKVFEALNGGQVITTTSSDGPAGKITVNATQKIIINNSANFSDRFAKLPERVFNILEENDDANSGFFVSSTGSGNTGNIEINSPKITLDNQGILNAESESVNGGNINLNVSELFLLRRGSQITTNTGTTQQGGNGGNITINAPNGFIVAFPKENSDITANAFTGTGGNVQINSQGIFGIEPRTEQTAQSDITASSQLGVPGNVNLTTPDNSNIQNSLTELLENPIDSEALIATSCVVRSRERNGTFFITGSQGFPYRPGDAVPSVYSTIGVQSVTNSISEKPRRRWEIGDPIVEPSGVYRLENGQRILSRECMK
ncbi:MAG: S-layer family protein, partial [Richelia sp. SL_2_1]|nr:S-layer family protein [Richelia sp. SL_2_1]